MLLKGDAAIRAARKRVWDFLTDPNQVGQCAPGVEKIEEIEPLRRYRGVVSVGLGSVKARFNGDVEIVELAIMSEVVKAYRKRTPEWADHAAKVPGNLALR